MPVLTFKGKTAVENYHHTVPHPVLELDPKLSVLGKGEKPSLDGNLIIEGDNLLALKALLPTHAGRVKCIYIDPPYNTGNEGWVYNDNLTQPQFKEWIGQVVGKEGEDACRHDKWCCMMYPRLQLLRELLREDGVLLVSIDDTELASLLAMVFEIFGGENHLGTLVWRARNFPDTRPTTGLSTDHEYVVVVGKGPDARWLGKRRSETKYDNPDKDPRGAWTSCSLLGKATRDQGPNLHYTLVDPASGLRYEPKPETGWICGPTEMDRKVREARILWPKKPTGRPREKVFLAELKSGVLGFPSIIDGIYTSDGTEELRRVFGEQRFAFPKPSALVQELIAQVAEGDDLVLDSFAGSGTTGHAVLGLNAADDGKRRFVLVQLPDDATHGERDINLCEEITAKRVSLVARGYSYRDDAGTRQKVAGLGGSFGYARIGAPLLGENRMWGETLPKPLDLARYIFYTETSREFDPKGLDEKSGKIGEHAGVSYYLLYTPERDKSMALDKDALERLKKDKNRRKVVYCEKVWVHREDLADPKFRAEFGEIRPMVLPFQVR